MERHETMMRSRASTNLGTHSSKSRNSNCTRWCTKSIDEDDEEDEEEPYSLLCAASSAGGPGGKSADEDDEDDEDEALAAAIAAAAAAANSARRVSRSRCLRLRPAAHATSSASCAFSSACCAALRVRVSGACLRGRGRRRKREVREGRRKKRVQMRVCPEGVNMIEG